MSNLLNIGSSALNIQRRGLAIAGHNIANANSEGYHRQRMEGVAAAPQYQGSHAIGIGTQLQSVNRVYDSIVAGQLREVMSDLGYNDELKSVFDDIGRLLDEDSLGVSQTFSDFFTAAEDLSALPDSSAAREVFFEAAKSIVGRFNLVGSQLDDLDISVQQRLSFEVSETNQILQNLADVNTQINNLSSGGNTAPDLLDRRDHALEAISEKLSISTIIDPNTQMVSVRTTQGMELVGQSTAGVLAFQQSTDGSFHIQLKENATSSTGIDITHSLDGGRLGGLIEASQGAIEGVRNRLGRMATVFAESVNTQHQKGLDREGSPGKAIYNLPEASAVYDGDNTGTTALDIAIDDPNALLANSYQARYSTAAGGWVIQTNAGETRGTVTTASDVVDGLALNFSGTAADGDRISFSAVGASLSKMEFALIRADDVASSSPINGYELLSGSGGATITGLSVDDPNDPALSDVVEVRFTSATQYDVFNVTTNATLASGQAFSSSADISVNGWDLRIEGSPKAGDVFRVEPNTSNTQDNRNIARIAQLASDNLLEGGTRTLNEEYSVLLAGEGAKAQAARFGLDAQEVMRDALIDRRESQSGVNLDEEATDLIQRQQAYQAAAQIISADRAIFDALIQVV